MPFNLVVERSCNLADGVPGHVPGVMMLAAMSRLFAWGSRVGDDDGLCVDRGRCGFMG